MEVTPRRWFAGASSDPGNLRTIWRSFMRNSGRAIAQLCLMVTVSALLIGMAGNAAQAAPRLAQVPTLAEQGPTPPKPPHGTIEGPFSSPEECEKARNKLFN